MPMPNAGYPSQILRIARCYIRATITLFLLTSKFFGIARVCFGGRLWCRICGAGANAVLLMRWVRINRRWSTYLALAAMALQLVLSFGHIHLEKLGSGSAFTIMAAAKAPSSQQGPAQHPASDADDYCAICATVHLISSSFLADAPLLPAPFASRAIEHFSYSNFTFILPPRAAFQSRAPPPLA
jgi:hypothetical protein